MEPLIHQLKQVRSRARFLLVLMRLSAWLAAIVAAAMALGVADYLLRLPGWFRLIVLLGGIGYAIYELARRVGRSMRVWPALTSLALRLERMYPDANGRLASAVAFATEPHPDTDSPLARQLARSAAAHAQDVLDARQVRRLIEPANVVRSVLLMLAMIGVLVGVAAAAPQSVATAFARWTAPMGPAAWPNRYHVESLTQQTVAPNNAPLRLAARVSKGDHEALRTWVVYKFLRPGEKTSVGEWQRALMTRQADSRLAGEYRRPLEPLPTADRVMLYFEAGDDQTEPQTIQLIQPPTVRQAIAEIDPPAYASKQIAVERHDLIQPPRPSVVLDALAGSRVRLQLVVEGSFKALSSSATAEQLHAWVSKNFPGIIDGEDADAVARSLTYVTQPAEGAVKFELSFVLKKPVQMHFNLTDAYGTSYEDQRLFRFDVRTDHAPRAAVVQPAVDESVLPTAVVDLAAEAQDDVAVDHVTLEARRDKHPAQTLAEDAKQQPRTRLDTKLDLSTLKLTPGEQLAVLAIVQDNYLLDGQRHDPVESAPRRLTIISTDEMTRQLRTDLAELRQRAIRARDSQQRLIEAENTPATARQQRDMVDRLRTLQRSAEALSDRMTRNRLKDDQLSQIAQQAQQMLHDTRKQAEQAANNLESAARDPKAQDPQTRQQLQQGRDEQKTASKKLTDLINLLDQGRDVYELKQKLSKLAADQRNVSDKVRKMLPQTLGKRADQLTPEQRKQLEQMQRDQDQLADQANQLMQRMQSSAAALSRQSNKPEDQANAEALRQAAETGTQKHLDRDMKDAAKQTQQNQLSQAQQQQASAESTISQMMQNLGKADQIRQQILQRRLLELVDSIRKLRDQQKAQLDRLTAAEQLDNLDAPLLTLRRNTQAVSESARNTDDSAAPVADKLDAAAEQQGKAVAELHMATPAKPSVQEPETVALNDLNDALDLAKKLSDKAQNKMNDEERAKLIKAYQKALDQQKAILAATQPLASTPADKRGRQFRIQSIDLGNQQADVRVAMQKLADKIDQTIVYKSVHDEVDHWAADASTDLRKGEPGPIVVMDQQMIVASIEALIDALKPSKPNNEFADEPSGGGGGGGGGKQPLVPPVAELKLLRQRQQQIQQLTHSVDQTPADASQRQQMLDLLGQQQGDLATTGRRMIQKLQQGGGEQ